jgi:4-hydroxybenzoate polyprenyltransferase
MGRAATIGRFLEIQNLGLNLPFAVAFLLVASGGHPTLRITVLVLVAFVAARNAGHSFNRWADRDVDARNPRTSQRLLVRRPELAKIALVFAAANAAALVLAAYLLSPLALLLVPVALLLVLGYSYTKRFTSLTTVFLGLVEGITPAGVYAGVSNALPPEAFIASFGLLAWGTAFEVIHSLGDRRSDAELNLKSIPTRVGLRSSRRIMVAAHVVAFALFVLFGVLTHMRPLFFVGLAAMGGLTIFVDRMVFHDPDRTKRPFQLHFALSALFLLAVLLGLFGPVL